MTLSQILSSFRRRRMDYFIDVLNFATLGYLTGVPYGLGRYPYDCAGALPFPEPDTVFGQRLYGAGIDGTGVPDGSVGGKKRAV